MITFATHDNISDVVANLNGLTVWIPIQSDQGLYYSQNRISTVYIYNVDTQGEYIINFHNADLDKFDIHKIMESIPDGIRISLHAKWFNLLGYKFFDLNMYSWYYSNTTISTEVDDAKIFKFYGNKYRDLMNINDVVPMMKILEYCRGVVESFLQVYSGNLDDFYNTGYVIYDQTYRTTLMRIELEGIHIDTELYNTIYEVDLNGNMLYGEYRPYTATGRVSYVIGGVNMLGLNKHDGSRGIITSRYQDGSLFELDYDGYHIRLIAELIGYKFPEGNVHEYLARYYFNDNEISDEDYDASKKITFKQLYGGIEDQYTHIEFFRLTKKYIDEMWDEYIKNGYIEVSSTSRKLYHRWHTNMTKTKLFNYIVQSLETERNAKVISTILDYLYEKKSVITLYIYDAILIDYDPSDDIGTINEVCRLMRADGYPVKIKMGKSYDAMVDVVIN